MSIFVLYIISTFPFLVRKGFVCFVIGVIEHVILVLEKKRQLLCVPVTDDVTKRKKNHETISSRFFTERKTKRSFVGHLCPVQEVLTKKTNAAR